MIVTMNAFWNSFLEACDLHLPHRPLPRHWICRLVQGSAPVRFGLAHSTCIGLLENLCCYQRVQSLEMMKFALIVFFAILLQVISVPAVYTEGGEGKCIKGKWHKASPSPETDAFKTCHAFKDNSCCTAEFTVELMANETRNLYNHSWHRCGQLSDKCQQFWITQVVLIFRWLVFCWFA